MTPTAERKNPDGCHTAGLGGTAERTATIPRNNVRINKLELIGSFCHASKSAVILLAGERDR